MNHYCYLIQSEAHPSSTYIGYTVNYETRLRKHNGEIKGGAKATKKYNDWKYVKVVRLDSKTEALSFEWYWKHYKNSKNRWVRTKSGVDNKLCRLEELTNDFKISTVKIDKI